MKHKYYFFKCLPILFLVLMVNTNVFASHIVGADLFYTWVSGNTYKITLAIYGDCGPAASSAFSTLPSAVPEICVFDGNTSIGSLNLVIQAPSTGLEITPVCPADISLTQCTNTSYTIPGIKKFVYTGNYTLPHTSSVWRFVFKGYLGASAAGAGRSAAITNISPGTGMQLVDTLNNTTSHNSSPILSVVPTPFFCLDDSDNYNPGALDPDGDSLSFYLVSGWGPGGTSIGASCAISTSAVSYISPYTPTAPLATSSFSFDQLTGQISFYPNATQRALVVYNVEEHRAGTLVGTSQREMTFLVLTCTNTPPTGGLTGASSGTIDDNTHFHICAGTGAFAIHINPTEVTTSNNITVTTAGLPTGSTFTTTGNGTPTPHCTFSWTSTGVTPGVYTFFVTYTDNNCPLSGTQTLAYTVTIIPPPAITAAIITPATCLTDAVVHIVPSGGISPWTVKVSAAPGDTIQTYTGLVSAINDNLPPGTYTFTVFNSGAGGCTAYTTLTIANPSTIILSGTYTSPTYCGFNDGTITLHHLYPGTIDTIKYIYNGVLQTPRIVTVAIDSTVTLSSLPAGTYSAITATYGNCISTTVGPFTLVNPPFTMRAISDVNPSWCGFCDGSITLYGLHPGQTDTLTYTLGGVLQAPVVHTIGSDSMITLTGLCAGTYAAFIAKTDGICVSNTLGPVSLAPPSFTMRAFSSTNPDFCGICNGTITLYGLHPGQLDTINYMYGGISQPPVILTIPSDSMVTITGLCAGTYTNFRAKTAGTCVSNILGPVILTVPPFTMRTLTSTNPDYCGICNGTITLYGLHPGATDTITYTKGGVAQTPVVQLVGSDSLIHITGLCAGTYANFIAHASGGCTSNTLGPVTLTAPAFTMRALSHTNPDYCGICNGTITLYGLHPGQTDSIFYTLGGVAQPPIVQLIPTDSQVVITGLCAGTYANFVAHTAGVCVSNTLGPVTLTVPPFTIRALSHTNPDYCGICNGTITIYGVHPGETDSITYTLGGVAQPPLVVTVGADSLVHLTGLCAGTYDNFIARNSGVCVSNALGPVTLTVPPFTMRALTSTNPDYCGICNGSITLFGLHPGEIDSISYTIGGIAQPPIVQLIGVDSTIHLTGLCAGTYANFIARTAGVCVSNTLGPVDLTVPPFTIRALSSVNPVYCGICNGSITIYGIHPGQLDTINFTKDGIAQAPIIQLIPADSMVILSGLCQGTYANFIAKTAGICVSNSLGPVDLTVPPFAVRSLTYTNPTKCGFCDGTATLHGLYPGQNDTLNYTFNGVAQAPVIRVIGLDSTIVLTGLCEGTYADFIVHTAGICVSNTLGPVTLVAPPIIPGYNFNIHLGCNGDTVNFTNTSMPASDLSYVWTFGDGTNSTETNPSHIYYLPGTYTVNLTITNTKCYDSIKESFSLNNLIRASFNAAPDSFACTGTLITFTNTSLGTLLRYVWSFGDGATDTNLNTSHTYHNTGIYDVKLIVTNYIPCHDTAVMPFSVDSISSISINTTDSVICEGTYLTLKGIYTSIGNTGVIWTFGDGTAIQNVNPVEHGYNSAGNFIVTVKALYRACPDTSASREIRVYGHPSVYLGGDTTICPGSNGMVIGDKTNEANPIAHWLWNTGATTPYIPVVEPGEYYVTVSVDGCSTTDTIVVNNDCYLDIPNVFSPNGDGINDFFIPRPLMAKGLLTFKMQIYNRWGQLIFESNNIEGRGWDGNYNDVAQPEGVYIYLIDATFKDGEREHKQGNITLLR